jgi:hypothetical protein
MPFELLLIRCSVRIVAHCVAQFESTVIFARKKILEFIAFQSFSHDCSTRALSYTFFFTLLPTHTHFSFSLTKNLQQQ